MIEFAQDDVDEIPVNEETKSLMYVVNLIKDKVKLQISVK